MLLILIVLILVDGSCSPGARFSIYRGLVSKLLFLYIIGGIQNRAIIRGFLIKLETSRLDMNRLEASPRYIVYGTIYSCDGHQLVVHLGFYYIGGLPFSKGPYYPVC